MVYEKSESINELAKALATAQLQLRPAVKDATNPHFRSKYADLGAVWEACREPLANNGLSVVQMPVDSEPGRVALMTLLMHTSGQYISSTVSTRLQKDDAQGVGSALTYLRRYSLASVVGIVADDDDDGNAASQKPQAPTTKPQTAKPFDADAARKRIAAHPNVTQADVDAATRLDTRDALLALYQEIDARVAA